MPEREVVSAPAAGISLPDARTGQHHELGDLPGVWVLSAIRHRH